MDAPPLTPPAGRDERAIGVLCVAVLTALAAICALWSVVVLPPVVDRSVLARIAESMLLAGPGLYFTTLYAGRCARSRVGALIPATGWLAVVVLISSGRPEGDNAYLLASYQGLLLAPLGMAAAALGLVRAYRHPWPAAATRD